MHTITADADTIRTQLRLGGLRLWEAGEVEEVHDCVLSLAWDAHRCWVEEIRGWVVGEAGGQRWVSERDWSWAELERDAAGFEESVRAALRALGTTLPACGASPQR